MYPNIRVYAHSHNNPALARKESPPTYFIDWAAINNKFGLRTGEGHPIDEFGYRVDDPNEIVVKVIWPARVRTMHNAPNITRKLAKAA